jgi:hypothetical protein
VTPEAELSFPFATALLIGVAAYLAAGLVFAVPFVVRGAGTIDAAARRGTWGFRLIILPGVVALWPVLAQRWAGKRPPPAEANAHRRLARPAGER